MLKRLTDRRLRWVIVSALAGTVLLSGCDQIGERIDRAKELADKLVLGVGVAAVEFSKSFSFS